MEKSDERRAQLLEHPQTDAARNRGSQQTASLMNVGFIGLGHMGAGMAANLLKAGHRVTVFNRTPAKAEALVAQGAKFATSIAEASRGDAVITMLANDEAVEECSLRPRWRDRTILPSGALHVSSSTISVALVGATDRGARQKEPAFCRRSGIRPARCRGRGTAVRRCRWRRCRG